MRMYDVFVLISNKDGLDWTKIYNKVVQHSKRRNKRPYVMSVGVNGQATCRWDNDILNDAYFYIINESSESNTVNGILDRIFECNDIKRTFVAVHKRVKNKFEIIFSSKRIAPEYFSHNTHEILWEEYIKPYIESLVNGDKEEIKNKWISLADYKKDHIINVLINNVLTPFIPYHIAYQHDIISDKETLSKLSKILERCQNLIENEVERNWKKLLSINIIANEDKVNLESMYENIVKSCKTHLVFSEEGKILKDNKIIVAQIEEFATSLNAIYNCG